MAGKSFFLILFFAALLSSCATVGEINGGPKDTTAPKPIEGKSFPANGSTGVFPKVIEIEFDEYFKLVNPTENITISPSGIKLKASSERKKLLLHLEGELAPETTYQIIFANALADLHENNDSLMTYVFSTGATIDSLSFGGFIKNAYTAAPEANFTVGLYNQTDSLQTAQARYLTRSDKTGTFTFSYLKAGNYQLFGFNDNNKNGRLDAEEAICFSDTLLNVSPGLTDSLTFLAFKTEPEFKIRSKKFDYPAKITLGATKSLRQKVWTYENKLLDSSSMYWYSDDSLSISLERKPLTDFDLVTNENDTLSFRLPLPAKRQFSYELIPANKELSKTREADILFNCRILQVDTNHIQTFANDSVLVRPKFSIYQNRLHLDFTAIDAKTLRFKLAPNGVSFTDTIMKDSVIIDFKVKSAKDFGIIILSKNLESGQLLELVKDGKVCRVINTAKQIDFLEPGEYSFRLIDDANGDGKWTPGSLVEKRQAEKIKFYPQTVKVRANWETEVTLE